MFHMDRNNFCKKEAGLENKKDIVRRLKTLGVPWIHHSQEVEVSHSKYSGTVMVEKTIIKSDASGYTRMYI